MKKVELQRLEMVAESLDTIRVHNPTDEDFIVWNNKSNNNGIPAQKWVIPNVNKDVGFGKGNLDMPRHAAIRYRDYMTVKIGNLRWETEWEKLKKKYRRDEWERVEQRMTPRTNDPGFLKEVWPTIWVGLVHKQEIATDSLEEETVERFENGSDRMMSELGLDEKVVEDTKNEFVEAINDTE